MTRSAFVVGELPDHRKDYDPRRDLHAHGLRILDEHSEREQQTATVDDFHMQLQSVSVWSLISEAHLASALAALCEFCRARASGDVVPRVLVYETSIAAA